MTSLTSDSAIATAFETWLREQILRLSVDTLKSKAITCTACGEVSGEYIIDYQGNQTRHSAAETYAFLKFVETTAD